jgi:hypothetical protein
MKGSDANSLCLECGLCCNGVIFAHGQLQPEDNIEQLAALGLKFAPNRQSAIGNRKFQQPCSAFTGCKCTIYSERPKYCRQFECLLLKDVKRGRMKAGDALKTIRKALKRVEAVKALLRALGDEDESIALGKRFHRIKRRLESGPLDAAHAEQFGELTLAMHDLNVLLSQAFYPGTGEAD